MSSTKVINVILLSEQLWILDFLNETVSFWISVHFTKRMDKKKMKKRMEKRRMTHKLQKMALFSSELHRRTNTLIIFCHFCHWKSIYEIEYSLRRTVSFSATWMYLQIVTVEPRIRGIFGHSEIFHSCEFFPLFWLFILFLANKKQWKFLV